MALETNPVFLQTGGQNAEQCRRALCSLTGAGSFGATPSGITAGAQNTLQLQVTQNGTPNMSVNVATGGAWVPGSLSTQQGSYYVFNNAIQNVVVPTADPTNPRIDLICATIQDSQYAGANNQGLIQDVPGTPAGSPVAPALPANSLLLGQIAVAASAASIVTANITDKRVYLTAPAGAQPTLFGWSTALAGTPDPKAGAPFLLQAWSGTTATDGSGNKTIAFPATFPNGTLYCDVKLYWNSGAYTNWIFEPWAFTASSVTGTLNDVHLSQIMVSTGFKFQAFAIGF